MGADEIGRLETMLAELVRRWERYAARDPQVPLPPEKERLILERHLRRLAAEENLSSATRFRLDQLLHRFASYNQLWQRQLRTRELGSAGESRKQPRPNVAAPPPVPTVQDEVAALHARYAEVVRRRGAQPMELERFRAVLSAQRAQLEAQGHVVEGFDVTDVDGQARISARVRRGRKP